MVINVGLSWADETIPGDLKSKISSKGEKNKAIFHENTLHNADFIQLSEYLFKPYRLKEITHLENYLSSKKAPEQIKTADLQRDYQPRSNWERHFAALIKVEDQKLEKDWESLYELRVMVAHNKSFSFEDWRKVTGIAKKVSTILLDAIDKLDEIKLSPEEKNVIIESDTNPSADNRKMGMGLLNDFSEQATKMIMGLEKWEARDDLETVLEIKNHIVELHNIMGRALKHFTHPEDQFDIKYLQNLLRSKVQKYASPDEFDTQE
jgi:hypothetical protein